MPARASSSGVLGLAATGAVVAGAACPDVGGVAGAAGTPVAGAAVAGAVVGGAVVAVAAGFAAWACAVGVAAVSARRPRHSSRP